MNKTKSVYLSQNGLEDLKAIIDYLLELEKKHYEEDMAADFNVEDDVCFSKEFYNRPDINHIYANARRLKDEIDSKCVKNEN